MNQAGVRWLLIGRQALIHYGVPAQTMDYDIWVDPAPANVRALLQVARSLNLDAPRKPMSDFGRATPQTMAAVTTAVSKMASNGTIAARLIVR